MSFPNVKSSLISNINNINNTNVNTSTSTTIYNINDGISRTEHDTRNIDTNDGNNDDNDGDGNNDDSDGNNDNDGDGNNDDSDGNNDGIVGMGIECYEYEYEHEHEFIGSDDNLDSDPDDNYLDPDDLDSDNLDSGSDSENILNSYLANYTNKAYLSCLLKKDNNINISNSNNRSINGESFNHDFEVGQEGKDEKNDDDGL